MSRSVEDVGGGVLLVSQFTAFAPVEADFGPVEMGYASLLGLVFGLLSYLWVRCLYGIEHLFNRIKIANDLKPAIGAIPVGIAPMAGFRSLCYSTA